MKNYNKPNLTIVDIDVNDIMVASVGAEGKDGYVDVDIFGDEEIFDI